MTEARVLAGPLSDFPEGTITPVNLHDQELVIVCREGEYFALPDRCTHQRYPLHDGELDGDRIRCIRHGATFNLYTGKATMPALRPIRLFQTEVEGTDLYVKMQQVP
ncbi:MAG TPA: Rieske 2Fe-2S domain-containing protein [Deinococcales bacterium]|nr:Rieske 2Fe-2S domain-containing protein [Deinococcales bacterium]